MSAVLLVEDREDNRATYSRMLEMNDIVSFSFDNKDSALKAYKNNPSYFNGVLTDIRLKEGDPTDESGIDLCKEIKRLSPSIPVFGVTAHDIDFQAQKSKFNTFTKMYKKVSASPENDFTINFKHIVKKITSYENPQFREASENLERIRNKYHISDGDFHSLLSNFPVSRKVETLLLNIHESHDEEEDVHYEASELFLIEPEDKYGVQHGIKKTLPVVISEQTDGVFVSEILLMPTVYSYGDSKDESLDNLLDSLLEYRTEINKSKILHFDTIRFGKYLESIFRG